MTADEVHSEIDKAALRLFYRDPLLFKVYCTHTLTENTEMEIPFRSGCMRIEYNPALLASCTVAQIRSLLKTEITRITLRHPYERKPDPFKPDCAFLASNLAITQKYLKRFHMPKGRTFEEYYQMLDQAQTEKPKDDQQHRDRQNGNVGVGSNGASGGTSAGASNSTSAGSSASAGNSASAGAGSGTGAGNGASAGAGSGTGAGNSASAGVSNSTSAGSSAGNGASAGVSNSTSAGSNASDGAGSSTGNGASAGANNSASSTCTAGCTDEQQLAWMQSSDGCDLWGEDNSNQQIITDVITKFIAEKGRGTISEQILESITPMQKADVNYSRIVRYFRESLIHDHEQFTRMKPNRRCGYEQMGRIRTSHICRLLVAIDTSGSVADSAISCAFAVINGLFKKGVHQIDEIEFDSEVKNKKPHAMKRKLSFVEILGRGGTDFQPVFDFVENHKEYEGLIIITDGYAPPPVVKRSFPAKVLWMCTTDDRETQRWMNRTGRYYYLRCREKA